MMQPSQLTIRSEEAQRVFYFLAPYIEAAGYKWIVNAVPDDTEAIVNVKITLCND